MPLQHDGRTHVAGTARGRLTVQFDDS